MNVLDDMPFLKNCYSITMFKSLNKVYTFLNYDTTDKRGRDYPIKRDRQKF